MQPGCKESQFYGLPFGQVVVVCTRPRVFLTSPRKFLISSVDYSSSVIWISKKKPTCPLGKLRTEFTSPISKSTSSGLSDTTFFARCAPLVTSLLSSCYMTLPDSLSLLTWIWPGLMAWYEHLIIPLAIKSGTEVFLICDISLSKLALCSFPPLQKPLRNHCSFVSTKALSLPDHKVGITKQSQGC